MTLDQVKSVSLKYIQMLPGVKVERFTSKSVLPTREMILNHSRWMCQELSQMEDTEKAMRWLGFVQGIFWVLGKRTIEEMRSDNRMSGE
jgi:hypothetical protein